MTFSRQVSAILIAFFLLCASIFAAEPSAPVAAPPVSASSKPGATIPVLPNEFAGWQVKGDVARSDDPASADAANAPVLKEYGFVRLEKAAYTRDDGRNLTVEAAVFEDASGAYGAFTYYYSE